nr:right-handed parallel beta-helix repeat-containing protein [uncultured Arsenicibacter sp.]
MTSTVKALLRQPQGLRITLATRFVALLASLALLTTACKKETEPTPAGIVTAAAGPDQQVQVGQPVALDGSASTDSKGKPLTAQWAFVRKPAKSTATLQSPTTLKPAFTPDETGEYELELTVSSETGKSTDKVLVTASVAQPLAITANISVKTVLTDRVLNPDLPDYIVTKSIAVNHELTINPGVVIAFERDTRLDINDNGGIIIAKGEANNRIRFVGVEKTKGYWAGIMLYSGSNANVFDYVDVMHTGSRTMLSTTKAGLAFFGSSKAQLALKNTVFTQNDGYGIYVQDGGILREFAANTFSNNTEAGILLNALNVAKLDAASKFTGNNGRDVVEISASAVKDSPEVTWAGFADKTPYRITGTGLTVDTGFKLSPGVVLEFARDASMMINSGGYLSAVGTATNKVVITGANRTAGYWRGIISYSTSSQNVLENAELSNAGSTAIVSGKKANLAIYGNLSAFTVKQSLISGSGGYGIFVAYGAKANADINTANTFNGNVQGSLLKE